MGGCESKSPCTFNNGRTSEECCGGICNLNGACEPASVREIITRLLNEERHSRYRRKSKKHKKSSDASLDMSRRGSKGGAGSGAGLDCFLGPAPPGHTYKLTARAHVAKGGTATFDVRCGDEDALLAVFDSTEGGLSPAPEGSDDITPSLTFDAAGTFAFNQTIVCPFGGGPLEIVGLPGFGGITAIELEDTACADDNGIAGYVTGLQAFAVGKNDAAEYDEAARQLTWMFLNDGEAPGGSYFEGQCQVMQCEVF